MPRCLILSAAERECLLALPDTKDELIRHYTLNESDLAIIRQRRGPANRLGFAVQLCYMRYPGVMLAVDEEPFPSLLRLVATQLRVPPEAWTDYGQRAETGREHLLELQSVFGYWNSPLIFNSSVFVFPSPENCLILYCAPIRFGADCLFLRHCST